MSWRLSEKKKVNIFRFLGVRLNIFCSTNR